MTRAKRNRIAAMMEDPEFWDNLFEIYSVEKSLPTICKSLEIPFQRLYTKIRSDPELNRRFLAARQGAAESAVAQIWDVTDALMKGKVDPASAKAAINSYQWLAERYSPVDFAPKQSLDVKVTDGTKLHLEALKEAMRQTKVVNAELQDNAQD